MSRQQDENETSPGGWLLWVIPLIVFLYVSSYGPVCSVVYRFGESNDVVDVLYRPLLWATEVPLVGPLLEDYSRWLYFLFGGS